MQKENTKDNAAAAPEPVDAGTQDTPKKSLSRKKLEANRANAKLSTGPQTPEGKAKSSKNAITHGIFAKQHLAGATPEMIEEMTTLAAGIWEQYQPVGLIEELLAQKILVEVSRRGRIMAMEQEELGRQHGFFGAGVDRVLRYSTSADRALFRAIQELERVQAARKAAQSSMESSDPESTEGAPSKPRSVRRGSAATARQAAGAADQKK